MTAITFGVQLLPQEVSWAQWRDGWLLVDSLGYHSNWSYDHVHAPRGAPAADCFEGWVGMAALAALTPNAWTGMLVSPITFRNPGLMVKMATTLDHVTNGKSIFGLGAGWHVNEHQAYGFGFPPPGERVSRLEEALKITHALWGSQPASFDGTNYQLDQAYCNPAPLQQPHPPIMVAGGGPRIVGLVARYADMYDCWPPLSSVRERYQRLEDACGKIGRPFDHITRSLSVDLLWAPDPTDRAARIEQAIGNPAGRDPELLKARLLVGGAQEMIDQVGAYAEAGVQQVILHVPSPYDLDGLEHVARDVLPAFRAT
jgi:alkanesulfonate monooxygenase SsuD/methylene tetrahydromethanopterin reductase-like flavin-dependent oxidoreductase (luciferase family)